MPTPYLYEQLTNGKTMDVAPYHTVGVQVVGGGGAVEGTIDGTTWVAVTLVNAAIVGNPWRLLRLNGAGVAHIIAKG